MHLDPLPKKVQVTFFIESLRAGVARTEVCRVHPSNFEEADMTLRSRFVAY